MADETCEQRIGSALSNRINDIDRIINKDDDPDYDEWSYYPLSIDKKTTVNIQLSTGGPGDWFECEMDDGEIVKITYHFNDWFDHAERVLSGADYDAAERFCSYFTEVMDL